MKWKNQYPPYRDAYWDNIKGCLIILVVFAHFLFGLQNSAEVNTVVDAIYFFHMPAFVFVSGFFSKSPHTREKESILKLLSAFVLFHGLCILFSASPASSVKLLESYYSEWYLIALIIWRLCVPGLSRFKGLLPIAVIFSILIGFFPDGGNGTLAVNKVFMFLPFFVAGYLFQDNAVVRIKCRPKWRRFLICLGTVSLSVLIVYLCISRQLVSDIDLLANQYNSMNLVGPVARIAVIIVSSYMISFLLNAFPEKRIPLLTTVGKNSLAIYLLHRPVTLVFYDYVGNCSPIEQIALSLVCTMVLVILFGSDIVAGFVENVLSRCVAILLKNDNKKYINQNLFRTFFFTLLCAVIVYPVILGLLMNRDALWPKITSQTNTSITSDSGYGSVQENDPIYRVMSTEQKAHFDNAFRILFAGDLILLEDQVKNAYDGKGYNFSDCFEYTKPYISDADYSIGVFEGPMGGTKRQYSSSNYEDGKELYLNFPDEWGQSVKDAGFDLVTTANNHALDMGEDGLVRTIEVLEQEGLDHTGTYRSREEKEENHIKTVEKDGIRMAILSYTMSVNGVKEDDLVGGSLSYLTSIIVPEESPNFSKIKADVQQDLEQAKALNPDLIIVLPHWGTQFADYPDASQLAWENVFKENGADIILGDHTHSVQPVTINGKCFTLFCPGNYANIYRQHNGDGSALVEVYIDRESKTVIGGSIIPMWISSPYNGNYKALPIYDILTDSELGETVTTYDMERVNDVHKHITGVMLRHEMDMNMIQQRYYFDNEGFMRTRVPSIEMGAINQDSDAYKALREAKDVCFVGDSITEGTKNGGVAWYEPLEGLISGNAINCGWGSATTGTLLKDHLEEIANADADLYVIAIGANDIRYQDEYSAMTAKEYIDNLAQLRLGISEKNPSAGFIFIAPWTSTDGDPISKLGYGEKVQKNAEYAEVLDGWTETTGDVFVNANDYIDEYLSRYPQSSFLIDYIHPNATKGVQLYSEAFLSA